MESNLDIPKAAPEEQRTLSDSQGERRKTDHPCREEMRALVKNHFYEHPQVQAKHISQDESHCWLW
jgi:hypothetical protein